METRKLLSGLSYLSILFAGFIFPIIVFFVSDDQEVKHHAKKALLSHLIPLVPLPFFIGTILVDVSNFNSIPIFSLLLIGIFLLVSFVVFIWNIVKGVKILMS